jgi:hypothetical protein
LNIVPDGVLLINMKTMEIEFSNREMDAILKTITLNTYSTASQKEKLARFVI